MMVALAGRRVDSADTKERRFPAANVELVRSRIRELLQKIQASTLISSAACGVDLIALSEARALGVPRRRVILPFRRERFRETSVTDRPGDWGEIFDRILNEVDAAGDLVTLRHFTHDDSLAYATANSDILDEAAAAAPDACAVVVWDGVSRGSDDMSAAFAADARRRGLNVIEILTI